MSRHLREVLVRHAGDRERAREAGHRRAEHPSEPLADFVHLRPVRVDFRAPAELARRVQRDAEVRVERRRRPARLALDALPFFAGSWCFSPPAPSPRRSGRASWQIHSGAHLGLDRHLRDPQRERQQQRCGRARSCRGRRRPARRARGRARPTRGTATPGTPSPCRRRRRRARARFSASRSATTGRTTPLVHLLPVGEHPSGPHRKCGAIRHVTPKHAVQQRDEGADERRRARLHRAQSPFPRRAAAGGRAVARQMSNRGLLASAGSAMSPAHACMARSGRRRRCERVSAVGVFGMCAGAREPRGFTIFGRALRAGPENRHLREEVNSHAMQHENLLCRVIPRRARSRRASSSLRSPRRRAARRRRGRGGCGAARRGRRERHRACRPSAQVGERGIAGVAGVAAPKPARRH